jgi:hypothetical protein
MKMPKTTQMKYAGIEVVDTQLIRDAVEFARSIHEPFLYNHVMRSWLFAVVLGEQMKPAPDPELVAAAALLHDLGLTEKYAAEARFEVDGANAARSFLQARGVAPHQVQLVWDAIALHTHGSIALYKEPEVSVTFEGVSVDAVGYAFDRIPPSQMKAILSEFPRLGLKKGITACFTKVAREKPQMTYDNSLRDFGLKFVEGYHVAMTGPDLIANAPFED